MQFRRRRFKTAFLRALVHPTPLLEALFELGARGDIEWFEYGKYNTTIKLTRHSGLDMMIKEATELKAPVKPHIKNKSNEKFRKTKG